MRSEILISIPEVATTSARASMQRCLATSPATTWYDAATGIKHAGFNHTPLRGPGGSS